jgi:hypothetical protein
MIISLVFLEDSYDLSQVMHVQSDMNAIEIAHKWNELSRVSLLKIAGQGKSQYKIIHDNAESRVNVGAYNPNNPYRINPRNFTALPFICGKHTRDVLVMFAGCGQQMLEIYDYSNRKAKVTGVEINPLVKDIATTAPELTEYRLKEFYDLEHIELVIEEGRSFLETNNTKYDCIYIASDAPTLNYKTGHSRKYLDTIEAMTEYLKHLKKDGLLLFDNQPAKHKLYSLAKIFEQEDIGDIENNVIVLSRMWGIRDYIILSLTPFTPEEVNRIVTHWQEIIYYAPGHASNHIECEQIIRAESATEINLVTDNRPFVRKIEWLRYKLFPSIRQIKDIRYYQSWVKITTLLLVVVFLVAPLLWFYSSRTNMPPMNMLSYLLMTGFCYMLCEITFMAKLELFIGNPLYSMALLLCVFLIANAVGSVLFQKLQARLWMTIMPLLVAGIILVTVWIMDQVVKELLGFSLLIKIPIVVVLISPTAVCLGLFYPYIITWLSNNKMAHTIPVTYGISTMSSVAGAVYAMTMIINLGYNNVIYQAVVGYAALYLTIVIYKMTHR